MNPLSQASTFLIQTLFDLYLTIVLFRLLLQIIRADFYNPVSQFVLKLTNPLLLPLRRFIPGFKGIDWACVALLCLINITKLTMLLAIEHQHFPALGGLLLWNLGDLAALTINVFFFATLLQVIISWINPYAHHPVIHIIHRLTHPIMAPVRRVMPNMGGFDLTPIPVLLGLQLLNILIAAPMIQIGLQLALR